MAITTITTTSSITSIALDNTTSSTTQHSTNNQLVISDSVLWYFRLVVHGLVCQLLALLGITTNILNILVYVKLGVRKDPININLLGMSVSDFAACFCITYANLCKTPGFTENEDLPFIPLGTIYLFSIWPYIMFVKITTVITAFTTIERCLCVTYPLKIKKLITPRRVGIVMTSIYISMIVSVLPVYFSVYMKWVFIPGRNRSLYTMVFSEHAFAMFDVMDPILMVFLPIAAYAIIILSTLIFVRNLRKVTKWRSSVIMTTTTATTTTTTTNPASTTKDPTHPPASPTKQTTPALSARDTKLTKMVAAVSALYIVCYTPVTIVVIAALIIPDIQNNEAVARTADLFLSLSFPLELTSASCNIFIYLTMSTKYKTAFRSIFFKCK